MKFIDKIFTYTLLLFTVIACGDDAEDKKPENFLSFGMKTVEIHEPFFLYDQNQRTNAVGEKYYKHLLAIYSTGFKKMGSSHILNGRGEYISIQITSSDYTLQSKTYVVNGDLNVIGQFHAAIYINFNSNNPNGADLYALTEGTLTVSATEDEYEIDLRGPATKNGDKATNLIVHYKGRIRKANL